MNPYIFGVIGTIIICIVVGFGRRQPNRIIDQKEIIVIEVHSVNNLGEQIQKEIQKKQSEGYEFREFEVDTRPAFVKAYLVFEK